VELIGDGTAAGVCLLPVYNRNRGKVCDEIGILFGGV